MAQSLADELGHQAPAQPTLGRAAMITPANGPLAGPTPAEIATEVLTFLDDTLPRVLAGVTGTMPRAKAWRAALFDHGLAAIDYPVEYGGRGLGSDHLQAYREASRGRVPREDATFGIGVAMALPTIRDHGSPELRGRFLRPGLRGDEIWCQMYSEPGAGSDVAALTTRADLDGDEWIVCGQKVWTSCAQHSQFAILLARTDGNAPKHRGITMFVVPMDQPGVTVRPLVQMTGCRSSTRSSSTGPGSRAAGSSAMSTAGRRRRLPCLVTSVSRPAPARWAALPTRVPGPVAPRFPSTS